MIPSTSAPQPRLATPIESQGPFKFVGQDFAPSASSAGTISFAEAQVTLAESGGNAQISVLRSGGSTGAVTVNVATIAGGTATTPSDFTAVNTTVSFADGDSAPKTVNIPITSDNTAESDETVLVGLSAATGGALIGNQSSAQITISANAAATSGGGSGGCTSGSRSGFDPTLPMLVLAAALARLQRKHRGDLEKTQGVSSVIAARGTPAGR